MNCKVCNTRLGPGDQTCPNCGNEAPAEPAFSRSKVPPGLPSADLSTAKDRDREEDVELELDDVTAEVPLEEAPPPPARARTTGKKPSARKNTAEGAPLFAPDAAGLRALLAEQPGALETGLGVFRAEDGAPVGVGYSSGVGDIDLLATDASGDLVVVMISEKGQGEELVAEVLQRVGWVRKHMGGGDKKVRGIVLCEEAPESLSYTAAAVADTVSFKTYRVALAFEDLEF
jgi:hypothetical protein